MSDEKSKGKIFGRYHDLILLIIGFLLTTLVGGYLTNSWQKKSEEIQRRSEHKRAEQAAATKVFEEVSKLMDKRLYRMRRIHLGLYSDKVSKKSMDRRWDAYREVLFDWNENLNRNFALVQRYFGNGARDTLELEIQPRFIRLGELLEGKNYPNNVKDKYRHRQELADELNVIIYQLDIKMIYAIQSENVGNFRRDD